jgi:hypothetical protein
MTLIDTSKLFWDRVRKPLGAMINSDRREIHSMKALSVRVAALAFIGLAAASIAILAGADRQLVDVIVLGVALVAADLAELRPANRLALPLGFALVLVLLRAASATEFVVAVTAGSAAAVVLRTDKATAATRLLVFAEFLAAGLGAGVVFQLAMDAARRADPRAAVLGSLACAAFVEILVADLVSLARDHRLAPVRSRAAELALVSSGMLMAVGYGGIGGQGRLGLWGPVLFSIPMMAAWYSFELLGRTRRTFRQTVRALGLAPELGGLVREGHVERVADVAVALGRELGVGETELDDLETAAWLHHLGAVSLDEPVVGRQPDAAEVARASAEMLRSSQALASAGDVVAAEPSLHRPPGESSGRPAALMGQILKVASAYDELTEGSDTHAQWAIDALFTGPAYVYDGRVLTALETVLTNRGLISR